MKNYSLSKDEVVLYHGKVELLSDGKESKRMKKGVETEMFLTNFNFVFITTIKRILKKEEVATEVYSVSSVKFYREEPHIVAKKKTAEVYFENAEKFIKFEKKKELSAFVSAALRLVSGKSKLVRVVKRVQKNVKETDDELNIDIVGGVKTVASVTTTVVEACSVARDAKKGTKIAGMFIRSWKNRKEKKGRIPIENTELIESTDNKE